MKRDIATRFRLSGHHGCFRSCLRDGIAVYMKLARTDTDETPSQRSMQPANAQAWSHGPPRDVPTNLLYQPRQQITGGPSAATPLWHGLVDHEARAIMLLEQDVGRDRIRRMLLSTLIPSPSRRCTRTICGRIFMSKCLNQHLPQMASFM